MPLPNNLQILSKWCSVFCTCCHLFLAELSVQLVHKAKPNNTKREVHILKVITSILGGTSGLIAVFYLLVLVTAWL